ncbi:MAG: M14 family metallopeptidase [Betaproteobacteria bacterium]
MSVERHFARSYADAREKFRAASAARGARQFRYVHPESIGAEGEELSMDFAMLGRPDADTLLVVLSATHGAEGFCGSGCQVALMHDDAFMRAIDDSGAEVMLLHALNPYGFSHLRRVNEDNADLNRNFVDFASPLPVNAAYAELHPLLLPATWPPELASEAKLGAWLAANGAAAYQAAVSGGQYQFDDGLFFGGRAASWSNRMLRKALREHAASRSALAWIDFHTGLGPLGHGEKIYAGVNDAAAVARTRDWWGDDVTTFLDGSSSSSPLTGINGYAAHDEAPRAAFAGIALEYGTYSIPEMLQALRAEHWLHNHPDAPPTQRDAIKRRLRDVFYVDDDAWKRTVYAQALPTSLIALKRLAQTSTERQRA